MATDLQARLRAATMTFDWADLPDDANIPAVPLLREAADRLDALYARIQELEGALRGAADTFEKIREILIDHLNEPERSAFWAAVGARDAARSALGRNAE